MHIRRDKSNLYFGPPRRRGPSPVITVIVVVVLLAGAAMLQYDRILQEVQVVFGEPPTPTPSAPSVANEAMIAYANGDLEDATVLYAEAVRMVPDNIDYLYEYAHTLLLESQPEEGLAIADQMAELAPEDPRGHALRVLALYQLDRVDEAIADAVLVLEQFPNYGPTYGYLAWAYADIGRWEQAVQMGQRAIDLAPDSVDSYRAYAYALTWVGAREEAILALERAIELHPTLDFLYFEAAEKYRSLENVAAAIAAYEQALAIKPTNKRALLRLCETYLYLRDGPRAEEYCQQAIDIDSTYAEAWRQIGQVYYSQSKFDEAITAYDQCVALEYDSIYCYYQRGLAYMYLGQCDVAIPLLLDSMERTTSDRILGFVREGLRTCQQNPDDFITPTAAEEGAADATPEPAS